MSSINLFDTHYTRIENISEISNSLNEPDWLLDRRNRIFKDYKELPYDQDALFYKYTNFRKFNPDILSSVFEIDKDVDIDINTIKIEDMPLALIETEAGVVSDLSEKYIEMGVYFGSLHELIVKNEELAKRLISKIDAYSGRFDKLGSLSQAFATNITVLYVPKGVIVDELLVKTTILSNKNVALFSEFIAYLEEDSDVKLLEIFRSENSDVEMYCGMQTYILEDNARVSSSQIQNWGEKTVHMMARTVSIGRYAKMQSLSQLQGGELSRHNSNLDLNGNGSEGQDLFVKFGAHKQRFDIKSELHHNGVDTIGNVHARTVMMDKSESILRGLIVIPEPGVNADSWLTSQGMTMGKGKITAIPALKIDQNDVKAAHAASVEPLNNDMIFYLQSRGISDDKSREILIKGYFDYIHRQINNESIVKLSKEFLTNKWDVLRGN